MSDPDNTRFEQLIHKIDPQSRLIRVWPLTGGVSAQVMAIEIEWEDGGRQKMIVRRHGDVDFAQNPHIAADEYKLLHVLRSSGIPAPTPYYVDESVELFGRPYIVVEFVEGETVFAPDDLNDFIQQLTSTLSRIHQVDTLELSFLPTQEALYAALFGQRPAKLDDSLDEGRIREVLEKVWPPPARNPSALLHGDFWPGNILWREGQLTAVIDWEDARLGDPLADLANARLEILWALGDEAMHLFTTQYQAAMPALHYHNLPYWDLLAALRPAGKLGEWALDETAEQRMRERHHWFVGQAMENVPKRSVQNTA